MAKEEGPCGRWWGPSLAPVTRRWLDAVALTGHREELLTKIGLAEPVDAGAHRDGVRLGRGVVGGLAALPDGDLAEGAGVLELVALDETGLLRQEAVELVEELLHRARGAVLGVDICGP